MQGRDHGGGLDAAIAEYGGTRETWIDLSTGINPIPYPLPDFQADAWTALPDHGAMEALLSAARRFWDVPDHLDIVAAGGVSAIIASLPSLATGKDVTIQKPTYNEHEAAFRAEGFDLTQSSTTRVFVHPNNPDGRVFTLDEVTGHRLTIIDESFCDVMPDASFIGRTDGDTIILKGLGKFWGLAGARLGFAIGPREVIDPLRTRLGPWAVSGPALAIGAKALDDIAWADTARNRLSEDADRLDSTAMDAGLEIIGGTSLFRLYSARDSRQLQKRLAKAHIWSRVFPYSESWIRLGLPGSEEDWARVLRAMRGK